MRYHSIIWPAIITAFISTALFACWGSALHNSHHDSSRIIEPHFHSQTNSGCCTMAAGYYGGYNLLSALSRPARLNDAFFQLENASYFFFLLFIFPLMMAGGVFAFYFYNIRQRLGSFVVLNYFRALFAQGILHPKAF